MKVLSETHALDLLDGIRSEFAAEISANYEHRALDCGECPTPGACCLDEHFVNVRISRLEAVKIGRILNNLREEERARVQSKIDEAIERYKLIDAKEDGFALYACPLFSKGTGCLVHNAGKPLPCINHACYDSPHDLPPDEMLDAAEQRVESLNRNVYIRPQPLLPIPVAIKRFVSLS